MKIPCATPSFTQSQQSVQSDNVTCHQDAGETPPWLLPLIERLDRIEVSLALSVEKESYTVEEVAERLERAQWTVRRWCSLGQVAAKKIRGKGRTGEWRIPHTELVRLQNEGPAPVGTH
jgi:hypothetical protein